MKTLLLLFSTIFTTTICKGLLKTGKTNKITSGGDILGESFNYNGKGARGAIAYGFANTGGYSAENNQFTKYVKPEFVMQLPKNIPLPKSGVLESVEEVKFPIIFKIPSSTNYYDGSTKLNKITINCKVYANPTECVNNSSCGWCGSVNGCISGTNLGPLEPCVKSSYIFSAPYPNWNPQTRVVNENVSGVNLSILNK